MTLRQKVQGYLNKRGITQAEFCKRAGLTDRSRLARQLTMRPFYNEDDIKKITIFFEKEEGNKWTESR